MNILGVGGWEVAVILLIMLIVAGPKRMIEWAYVLGQYTSKLRKMWAETMTIVQKELNESGVDIELPKEIPTRGTLNQEVTKALSPLTRPFAEAMKDADVSESLPKNLIGTTKIGNGNGAASKGTSSASGSPAWAKGTASKPAALKPTPPKTPPAANGESGSNFGTWSGAKPASSDDTPADLGTWSGKSDGADKS